MACFTPHGEKKISEEGGVKGGEGETGGFYLSRGNSTLCFTLEPGKLTDQIPQKICSFFLLARTRRSEFMYCDVVPTNIKASW